MQSVNLSPELKRDQMAKNDTFTVAQKGNSGHVVTWLRPDGVDDAEWQKRIAGDHSETVTLKVSKAVAAALNDLAVQQFVIKAQGAARSELNNGKAAVQAKVNRYQYGARGTSLPSPVFDAKEAGLSLAQCIALEAAGITILNKPAK